MLQSIRPALKCKAIISNCCCWFCCINIAFIWLVCNNMYYATSFHLYFCYFTNLNLSGPIGFKIHFVSKQDYFFLTWACYQLLTKTILELKTKTLKNNFNFLKWYFCISYLPKLWKGAFILKCLNINYFCQKILHEACVKPTSIETSDNRAPFTSSDHFQPNLTRLTSSVQSHCFCDQVFPFYP